MTIKLLNQVDKYFHRVTTIPTYTIIREKKTLAAHAGTASNFFLGWPTWFNYYGIYFNNKQFPDGFATRILRSSIS